MTFAESPQNENPYQAPRKQSPHDGRMLGALRDGSSARLVARGLLYRKISITAPVEATLEFHGRSYCWDTVRVNGNVVAWKISWWRINPELEFQLPVGDQMVPGRVSLRLWPWLAFRKFRVEIADRVVYEEPMGESHQGS
jgi:hypothetical protein